MSISNQQILDNLFCIVPQFATTDPEKLACYNNIINLLRCQVNEKVLKCCGILAYVYLLAHMLSLQANPNIGIASNLSEGDLSIGLAVSPTAGFLQGTAYGKAYQDLIRRTVLGVFTSNLPQGMQIPYGSCGCGC